MPKIRKIKTAKKKFNFSKLIVFLILFAICLLLFKLNHSQAWIGPTPYNLIIHSGDEGLSFLSLDPQEPKITIFRLPSNLIVETVYGYGEYKIDSILPLGKLDGIGNTLLTKSLCQTFGLPVHGYLDIKDPITSTDAINQIRRSLIVNSFTSSIPIQDTIRFYRQASLVRGDKVDIIDLGSSRLLYHSQLKDQTNVFKFDVQRLDDYIRNNLASSAYSQNEPTIAIVNTTNQPGLASRVTRILTNTGVDVVSQTDNNSNSQVSRLLIGEIGLEDSLTFNLVKSLFFPEIEVGDTSEYRADTVLFLGLDYYQMLNQKPNK